jgi:hypothetical protein
VKGGIRIHIKSERRDPDPHQSEKRDLDPHQSDRKDPGIYIKLKGGILISIKVMQIRNTPYHTEQNNSDWSEDVYYKGAMSPLSGLS